MLRYTVHRLLIMIPTLLVISFITFAIIKLPPGDFLSNQIAELKSQGDSAALEKVEGDESVEEVARGTGMQAESSAQFGQCFGVFCELGEELHFDCAE